MDALSRIPWESSQKEEVEPLIVKTMLQSRMKPEANIPEEYFAERVLFKNMAVDTMPKLTPKDWVKEQMGGYGYP